MSLKQFSQKQKLTIVNSAAKVGIKKAAKIAGVHYTTVYDWRRKLDSLGEKGFLDYKPSYPGRGIKDISPEKESAVLDCWKSNPGFGPGQVRGQLRRQGITVSIRSVRKIMKANGYAPNSKTSNKEKPKRFEARRSLELAQMDILEFFINKAKVYLILLLDDFSRFILGWRLLDQTSVDAVIGVVADAVDRYGKMEEILTDRGFVFYSWRGINRFEKYLETEKIDHTHARPHHPQTLGKVEACNRRIKGELIDQQRFSNLHEAETAFESWVERYNYQRPHQGIGGFLVPAERFHGQAKKALWAIENGIDITGHNCAIPSDIERSVINLVLSPEGHMTLYLLGQPIVLTGGETCRKN
jgi:transposase InsO family protein